MPSITFYVQIQLEVTLEKGQYDFNPFCMQLQFKLLSRWQYFGLWWRIDNVWQLWTLGIPFATVLSLTKTIDCEHIILILFFCAGELAWQRSYSVIWVSLSSCLWNFRRNHAVSNESSALSSRVINNVELRLWNHGFEYHPGRCLRGMAGLWSRISMKLKCRASNPTNHRINLSFWSVHSVHLDAYI